jgi:DNA-directed RNA polymerase
VRADQAGGLTGSKIKDLVEIVDDDTAASGMSTQILESANEEEPAKPNKRTEEFRLLAGKFVKFSDVIPPVPTRGTFRVEDIKSSLYFFS